MLQRSFVVLDTINNGTSFIRFIIRVVLWQVNLADIHGHMRSTPKSQFLPSLSRCIQFDKVVSNTCRILSTPPQDLSVIVDLLYFLHMPPPPPVITFNDYFHLLWQQTIGKYVLHHQAVYLYIVVDKPDFLPPPRSIVHKSRASTQKSDQDSIVEPVVADEYEIPHGKAYSSILAKCTEFKAKLIEYMTSKFLTQAGAITNQYKFVVILDSPLLPSLATIWRGKVNTSESNEHGEADCAIWYHCIHSSSNSVLIVSSDTDSWVYGLGICVTRPLCEKKCVCPKGKHWKFHKYQESNNTNHYSSNSLRHFISGTLPCGIVCTYRLWLC